MNRLKWARAIGCALYACAAATAMAQNLPHRDPGIGVATPPEQQQEEAPGDVLKRFAAAYGSAGRPRIALYWNRDLSDRTGLENRSANNLNVKVTRDYEGTETAAGASAGATQRQSRNDSLAVVATQSRSGGLDAARRTTLSERDLWQVETEFVARLLDAGVVVLDRAAILRTTARKADGEPNMQAIETDALLGKADLLLEILMTRDSDAPLGWGFRSNLKDVKSGRLLGTSYLVAMPRGKQAEPVYRARPGGFDLIAPQVTVKAIGDTLAVDSMRDLATRFAALR
jgi:hypothetical protein